MSEFLGYRPQDNAEDYAADIERSPDTEDAISRQFHRHVTSLALLGGIRFFKLRAPDLTNARLGYLA